MASDSNSNNLKSRGRFDINAIPDHAKARNPHLFGEDGKGQARLPLFDGYSAIQQQPKETQSQQRIAELNDKASTRHQKRKSVV